MPPRYPLTGKDTKWGKVSGDVRVQLRVVDGPAADGAEDDEGAKALAEAEKKAAAIAATKAKHHHDGHEKLHEDNAKDKAAKEAKEKEREEKEAEKAAAGAAAGSPTKGEAEGSPAKSPKSDEEPQDLEPHEPVGPQPTANGVFIEGCVLEICCGETKEEEVWMPGQVIEIIRHEHAAETSEEELVAEDVDAYLVSLRTRTHTCSAGGGCGGDGG